MVFKTIQVQPQTVTTLITNQLQMCNDYTCKTHVAAKY